MEQIAVDAGSDLRSEHLRRGEVDLEACQVFKEFKQSEVTPEGHRPLEFHQQVDITVLAGFVARNRAEERERLHAESRDFSTVLLDKSNDLGPSHALSLHRAPSSKRSGASNARLPQRAPGRKPSSSLRDASVTSTTAASHMAEFVFDV